MIRRIWALYAAELSKAIHGRITWIGPGLVAAAVLSSPMLHPVSETGNDGYTFVAFAMPLAMNMLGFPLILLFSAGLVATELSTGTLRQTLLRPVLRRDVFLAKLLTGMTYSLLLLSIAAACSWGTAWVLGSLAGINYGGELVYSHDEMRNTFLLSAALAFVPLSAGGSMALLWSTLTRNPLTAATLSIGIWIGLDLFKYPLRIEKLVFTSYLDTPWQVYATRCDALPSAWFPMAGYSLATSLPVVLLCSVIAMFVLESKDLSG